MATIRDVAARAGVSIATVSRVYNGARDVGAATAARVRAAGDELGYRPRSAARALPTGRARVFGAVFNDAHCEVRPDHPFFGPVLSSFSASVAEAGYEVLLLPRLEGDSRYLARAREHALSGLIVFGGGHDAQVEPLVGEGIPVVGVDYGVGRDGWDSVTSANAAGMRLVVEHLVELGHTEIGFIGGSPETTAAIERLGGFSAALLEHGLALRPEWLVTCDFTFAGGRAAARSLLDRPVLPSAIVGVCDDAALGAGSVLREQALTIGVDVSITGFDDGESAAHAAPPLTTVRQDRAELGRAAARVLLARVEQGGMPATHVVPVELVVRGSTAPAAAVA